MEYDQQKVTDHVIRLAALYTPKQLKGKALMLVLAFLFQHECLLEEVRDIQLRALEGDCDDPAALLEDMQWNLHALLTDGTKLNVIHELLCGIDDNFDRASPPVIRKVVDHMHRAMDDTDQRARLERLFSHPIKSDEHPE